MGEPCFKPGHHHDFPVMFMYSKRGANFLPLAAGQLAAPVLSHRRAVEVFVCVRGKLSFSVHMYMRSVLQSTQNKLYRNMQFYFITISFHFLLLKVHFTAGTYNNPRENSADVCVMPVQPLLSILLFKSDTGGFKTRLFRRSWCQRRELVWKI